MKKFLKNYYNATGVHRMTMDVCLIGAAFCIGVNVGIKLMREGGR